VKLRPLSPRVRRALQVVGGLAFLVVIAWFVVIPYPFLLGFRNPERTALMKQRVREARAAGDTLVIRQEWMPLDGIARNLQRAVLVAEDDAFYQHEGVDWRALAEEVRWEGGESFSWWRGDDRRALKAALAYAWEHRSELRGRSTITQQVAKNLYFGTDRSFLRKGMEYLVARRLERRLEKDRILEIYLNIAEWGPGIFGAEAASRAYFGRGAADLSLSQAAALAATLPHPLTSNPERNPGRMRWRQALILDRLNAPAGATPPPIPLPDLEPPVVVGPAAPGQVRPVEPEVPRPDTVPLPAAEDTMPRSVVPDTTPPPAEPPYLSSPGPLRAPSPAARPVAHAQAKL
jgi:monofunctional glycosyltransferase